MQRSVLGLGVSAVPARRDLEIVVLDRERSRVGHDVDRLSVTVYAGPVDVILGRQAVTWGWAALFPVADLWSRFGPYELETEEKPGLDAARVLTYPGGRFELDFVAADRGATRDASAGAPLSGSFAAGDAYVAAGKFWREFLLMGGALWCWTRSSHAARACFPAIWTEGDGTARAPPQAWTGSVTSGW